MRIGAAFGEKVPSSGYCPPEMARAAPSHPTSGALDPAARRVQQRQRRVRPWSRLRALPHVLRQVALPHQPRRAPAAAAPCTRTSPPFHFTLTSPPSSFPPHPSSPSEPRAGSGAVHRTTCRRRTCTLGEWGEVTLNRFTYREAATLASAEAKAAIDLVRKLLALSAADRLAHFQVGVEMASVADHRSSRGRASSTRCSPRSRCR